MLALALAGCKLGPNYVRPALDVPRQFRGQSPEPLPAPTLGDLPWWELFHDPHLKDLIAAALTGNYDVRVAVARIEQSRAIAQQVHAQLYPQLGFQFDASRGRNSVFGTAIPGLTSRGVGNAFLGAIDASWEIDLWGRIRRSDEAARARILASENARRAVLVTLVSDVAQNYFELLDLDLRRQIAIRTTGSFQQSLHLFEQRYLGGVASKLDTSRAEASLASTAAQVPDLERAILIKENQISVLVGRNPGPIPRSLALLEQDLRLDIPAGLPSSLLQRRPDIRQSEANLMAANAQIGVAAADFFPQIGLTALYGGVSSDLGNILNPESNAWSVAATLTGPIFQGGRLRGQYRQAFAQWDEARLQYQQVVLNAFQEVSSALIAREKYQQQRRELARSVRAYEEAVRLARTRYVAGKANYYEVLEAQQQLFIAENALALAELNEMLAAVQLYRALGGGWQENEPVQTTPPQKLRSP